jgi:hypothetical protein
VELPLNGRNANDLITLSAAAVNVGSNTAQHGLQGNQLIAVTGGNEFGVEYNLDGAQLPPKPAWPQIWRCSRATASSYGAGSRGSHS